MKALKFWVSGLILIGVVLFFASPYWVLYQINQAYQQNNAVGISKYIDFAQVKASLKPQIQQRMHTAIGIEHLPQALQKWGNQLNNALGDQLIDVVMNEQTILLLMQGKELKEAIGLNTRATKNNINDVLGLKNTLDALSSLPNIESSLPEHLPTKVASPAKRKAHYTKWNQFDIVIPTDSGSATRVIMTRAGLSWKITAVLLPS
nr:DUF2939 domain-containing protein [Acinetobacter sp.]